MDSATRELSRRRALVAAGTATVGVLAGCVGGSDGGENGGADGSGDADGSDTPDTERLAPPVKGDPGAAVTLAVFEDYACPHCADYNAEGFPDIEAAYVDPAEIRYEHRDLPIPVADPGSWQAANAARAVQQRNGDDAFWSYAAALFDHSGAIAAEAPELFGTLADEQGHDGAAIRERAVDRAYESTVQGDRQEAVDLGVEGTPGFVVNGEIVASGFGSGTVETVSTALDEALSETG